MTKIRGKCSWFGGPDDQGVAPDEGLAFIYEAEQAPHLFLPEQPIGTTGLARRLDPAVFYIATRWDYDVTSKDELLFMKVQVRALKTGKFARAYPADWGPNQNTGRIADLSPGLMEALGISTDDEVEVSYDAEAIASRGGLALVISSGHGLHVEGADAIINEVTEARAVVDEVTAVLRRHGIKVTSFHDDISTSQDENLHRIVDFHNHAPEHELDVSVHFNATPGAHGTECWYVSQDALAEEMSAAIATAGFTDRGAKYSSGLYFLNHTIAKSILIEVCFVDSQSDVDIYRSHFEEICDAIAAVLAQFTAPSS